MPGTSALDRLAPNVTESSPIAALMAGNRRALAKAITLVESTRSEDREAAQKLLEAALPHTGRSMRIGISGVPGVGKSTFIEALGMYLIEHGHRLPDILDYTLAQMRGFSAATVRADAARDANLLSLIAIGTRGDSRHLDQTLDRLQDHAHLGSHR